MKRYSIFSLLGNALAGRDDWPLAWRSPAPKKHYDAVIIGGGGHGLATAYFLAKEHGMRNIAVLERGAIGQGNSGRNTQVVRSDYYHLTSSKFFDRSLKLYEGLSRELNSNNALRVVLREGRVGLVNGLAFAVITGVAAVAWFKIPGLGIVIGLAIICNLIAGALGGILIPMVLERVRADPAVASGTFVTTITDVVGFFSFLGIATLWFGLK